jgi:hypothetical protein
MFATEGYAALFFNAPKFGTTSDRAEQSGSKDTHEDETRMEEEANVDQGTVCMIILAA